MSIFDLNPAELAQQDELARLHPYDPANGQAGPLTGMFQGLGEGVMRGGAKLGGLPALASEQASNDYTQGLAQDAADYRLQLAPLAGKGQKQAAPQAFAGGQQVGEVPWLPAASHDAADAYTSAVDYWTPSAQEVGTAGQVLGGLGEMVLPLMLGGGNPAGLGMAQATGTTMELRRQGVDPGAAADVGLLQGASVLVGAKLPAAFGANLWQRLATGAAGNLAVGRVTSYGQQAVLEASGDTKAAKQFDPWQAQSVALDTLMGLAFGGVHHLQVRGGDAVAPRELTQAEREAVLAANNAEHFARDTMPGAPLTEHAAVAHQRALETAIDQVLRGEPVDVAGTVGMDEFALRPELREADPLDAGNFGLPEAPRTIADDDAFWQAIPAGENGRETVHIDTPERQALREQLVEEHFADAQPRALGDGERPIAFVMGGGGASGKGTVLAKLKALGEVPLRGAVEIDPDRIKTGGDGISGIPEYQVMRSRGDGRAAAVVHEESSGIAKQVLARAIAGKYDIVLDRTLGDKAKGMAELQELKDAGYEVRLYGVTIDPKTAVRRAVKRAQRSGRYVQLGSLLKAHKGFAGAFEDYANLVDDAHLFDNSGTEARIIAEKAGEGLKVGAESAYNDFRGRSDINAEATTYRALEAAPAGRTATGPDARGMGEGTSEPGHSGVGDRGPRQLAGGSRGAGEAQGGSGSRPQGREAGLTEPPGQGAPLEEGRMARDAIAANPDLMIADDDGRLVPAAEFLAAADAEAATAQDTARGIEAAAACLLRNIP